MSKVKKSAGVRVSSTSGGDTASNPATQAVSARIDGQQAIGPLRFGDARRDALLDLDFECTAQIEALVSLAQRELMCQVGLAPESRRNLLSILLRIGQLNSVLMTVVEAPDDRSYEDMHHEVLGTWPATVAGVAQGPAQ